MYDVIKNPYHLIVSLQMETGNEPDRSNNIPVSIGLQNVIDRYGTGQKAIRYNGHSIIKRNFLCNGKKPLKKAKTFCEIIP